MMKTSTTAVTVFPDRARVTRSGQVDLQTGAHRLEITDLPLAMLPDSVRATGRGTARAKLVGVSTRLENFLETPAEAARELETQIQATEDADADLAARSGVLETERKNFEGLAAESRVFARGLARGKRTPEEQGAIFAFVVERLDALQKELLAIARERRDLAKELDRLRRELRNLQAARPKQRYVVTIELEVAEAGGFNLELTYVVRGAAWSPLYDLRLTDAGLDVTYLAQVAQNTGEDWPEVDLTLSTAQPALSLEVPELDPWYVAPYQPPAPPMEAKRMKLAAAAPAAAPVPAGQGFELAAADVVQARREEAELEVEAADISEAGASLTYHLSARADIPGNKDPRKVTVAGFSLKPEMDYITAPKLEAVCYRRAKVKNDSAYSLLPGTAQLFEGDEYLGATELEFTAPGQTIELALGADERLRVERELANREVDKTFMRDRRRIRYGYTIEVENLRAAPQVVIVRDQLPVSRDEQIKVRLESAEPKPAEHSELNLLEWKLELPPAEKQTIRFDFAVEHPRDMRVLGLP